MCQRLLFAIVPSLNLFPNPAMKLEVAITALHWTQERNQENYILRHQAREAHMHRVADWTVDDGIGRHGRTPYS